MLARLILGVACLLLAVPEFVRAGSAAAAVVRHPGDLVDAILAGDGSVGPWLLVAYGVLMLARAWERRG